MSGVRAIFGRELAAYLTSSIGYLVAAVVLLLAGLLFYSQALGPEAGERISGEVLAVFFYNASGLTAVAALVLSVRLIAEERQTGTHILLTTSPLRDWEIVLGKYLGALAFLTGILLLTLYMPLLIFVNGKVSIAQILVGYFGLVLFGSALPTISRRSVADHQGWKEYWRFTPDCVARGFAEVYGEENVQVEPFGNVMAATAFLLGLATHEIGRRKLDHYDPDYPTLVAVTAYKE